MTLKRLEGERTIYGPALHMQTMAEAIAKLRTMKARGKDRTDRPSTLRAGDISTLENVFQARRRGLNERHLHDLESAIRAHGPLEPVIVWPCGAFVILLEGHHRLEAYSRVQQGGGEAFEIPVAWFEGTVEEAVIRASSANSRAKLPMTSAERGDHAWRLVVADVLSAAQVVEAASVSRRTVMNMRSVAKRLGWKACQEIGSWRRALSEANGDGTWLPEEAEARVDALGKDYADRMAKQFSTKLAHNPEVTGRAFSIYFNRKSEEVIKAWMAEIGIEAISVEPADDDLEEDA